MRVEILAVAERVGIGWTKRLLNTCMREGGEIQEEWRTRFIVPLWKRKGDLYPGQY